MSKRSKPVLAWAGFSDGRVYREDDTGEYDSGRLYIFRSRKAARRGFADVRRVKITEVRKSDGNRSAGV